MYICTLLSPIVYINYVHPFSDRLKYIAVKWALTLYRICLGYPRIIAVHYHYFALKCSVLIVKCNNVLAVSVTTRVNNLIETVQHDMTIKVTGSVSVGRVTELLIHVLIRLDSSIGLSFFVLKPSGHRMAKVH